MTERGPPPLRQQSSGGGVSTSSSTSQKDQLHPTKGKASAQQQGRPLTPSTVAQLQQLRARAAREQARLERAQNERLQQRAMAERKAAVQQLDKLQRSAAHQRARALMATYGNRNTLASSLNRRLPPGAAHPVVPSGAASVSASTTVPRLVPPPMGLETTSEMLGEGATASVWLGRFGPNRAAVAAKVVRKSALNAEQLQWIRDEISIHKPLRHAHICTLHGAIEDASTITMILSICRGGSLCDSMGRALETNCPIGEVKSRAAFLQLCGALHYCHRNGVVHRDIKLDNLCWADADETVLVLIDFGYAATSNEQSNFAGSPHYAAPEVHRVNRDFEEEEERPSFLAAGADVWSAGVCLFAMLATALPFSGGEDTPEEQAALRDKVCSGVWDVQPSCSEAAVDVLTRMLTVDPDERCSLDDVCEHEWVGGADNIPWQAL